MARTKASVGAKISTGKSSKARCSAAPPPSSGGNAGSSDKSSRSYGGGNPVCPRETPKWQRPITNFFNCPSTSGSKNETEVSDVSETTPQEPEKRKSKRNIIESDDESEESAKNRVLDESINLEPLTGDDSHKLEEYYPKNGENQTKGKGVGKKSTNKENMDCNKRESVKRDSEFEDEESRPNKKSKVDVC